MSLFCHCSNTNHIYIKNFEKVPLLEDTLQGTIIYSYYGYPRVLGCNLHIHEGDLCSFFPDLQLWLEGMYPAGKIFSRLFCI